jgi:uncharacterized protein (TIGR02117 family)
LSFALALVLKNNRVMKTFWLIISGLIISACSSKPYVVNPPMEQTIGDETEIFILNHGWHTGVVVPAADMHQKIPELKDRYHSAAYLEFGWGDEDFYQAKEVTTSLTLKALFWPTSSVIHTAAKNDSFYMYFPTNKILTIKLDGNRYSSLLQFISESFYKDENDDIIELKSGIYGDSQFYKGVGTYYLFNTCNKWTAKALKSAGLDLIPIFYLTAGSIMNSARKYSNTGL